jgi:hypothetical protein
LWFNRYHYSRTGPVYSCGLTGTTIVEHDLFTLVVRQHNDRNKKDKKDRQHNDQNKKDKKDRQHNDQNKKDKKDRQHNDLFTLVV